MLKIELNGEASRSFVFPAAPEVAMRHYSELPRLVGWLPHITLQRTHRPDAFRLLYSTRETGIYAVNLYCDIQVFHQPDSLHIAPISDIPPVSARTGLNSLTAQAFFSSESVFHAQSDHTLIDYHLKLQARLPVPTTARLIPASVLDLLAQNIMEHRIKEIVEGFIQRSLLAFRHQT